MASSVKRVEVSPASAPSNVRVIVRARPLNGREKDIKSEVCVTFDKNQIVLTPKAPSSSSSPQKYPFTFDSVYPESSTQQEVFAGTTKPLLDKFLQGFNVSIFAYGQTGSGKTFTMSGSDAAPGIIPLATKELFALLPSLRKQWEVELRCTFIEIYQETLRDLLSNSKAESNLQIREDPRVGLFVQNATERIINDENDLLKAFSEGQEKRVVGETKMNATSSRSHTLFSILLMAKAVDDAENLSSRISKLHLVDLAGSERAASTGATGERLKEGAMINASLSSLGNVINALVSNNGHVPYRDSKLTRLLQDSLGGSAVTCMIANISPAAINADESLSTLRFADRAKHIKNKPVNNKDPKAEKIAKLLQENRMLRDKIIEYEKRFNISPSCLEDGTFNPSDDGASDSSAAAPAKCCRCSIM